MNEGARTKCPEVRALINGLLRVEAPPPYRTEYTERVTPTTTILVTHDSRERERAETLRQLALARVHPALQISTNRDPNLADAEVRRLGGLACRIAHVKGTALLFLEDDIDVDARTFPRHLAIAEQLQVPTTFCVLRPSLWSGGITRALAKRRPMPVSLVPLTGVAEDRGFHGSMAVFLPRAMVAHAAMAWREFERPDGGPLLAPAINADRLRGKVTGFDFWIKENAGAFGGLHGALPNSVDHRSPASVKAVLAGVPSRASARSGTFGWPTTD